MLPPRRIPWMTCVLVAAPVLTWAPAHAGPIPDGEDLLAAAGAHAATGEAPEPQARLASSPTAGLRTDRLSPRQRERWQSIVRLALAEDSSGQPLHPTLRQMWDQVATSRHEVYVELPEPNRSSRCIAGLFRVESVRPDGRIVALVRLHLETIDQATVADSPSHGFRRFEGLGREARYLEVLGHELGHAVWTLQDPVRARQSLALRTRPRELAWALLKAEPGDREVIQRELSELGAQAEAQEIPARAAEARVWQELARSRVARGVRAATGWPPVR